MFDQDYFENVLKEQIAAYPSAAVEIHLSDARMYHVRRMYAAHPGFVILEVYGETGTLPDPIAGERFWDQLAVPYGQIASVVFTTRKNKQLGFIASE